MSIKIKSSEVEQQAKPTPCAWALVVDGLSGLRLHAYEDLNCLGDATDDQITAAVVAFARSQAGPLLRAQAETQGAVANALRWLGHHRLAHQGGSGRWRARSLAEAMPIYLERGPDRDHEFTSGCGLAARERSGDRRNQDAHGCAHAEAAGGAPLKSTKPTTPHVAPVFMAKSHSSQFFDFGDY